MNATTADFAATVPWKGITGKPDNPIVGKIDISQLDAAGWLNGQTVRWNSALGRFVPTDFPTAPTSGTVYSLPWDPGTVTVFGFVNTVLTVVGSTTGSQVVLTAPYRLNGCTLTWAWRGTNNLQVTLFNPTPSDVTFVNGLWKARVFN